MGPQLLGSGFGFRADRALWAAVGFRAVGSGGTVISGASGFLPSCTVGQIIT